MKVQIPKITIDPFEAIGDEAQEAELDRQEQAAANTWIEVYNNIASGRFGMAFWDCYHSSKYNSFMRYALHRSTKKDGFLQLSVMEIRGGEIIPTSDSQHRTAADFLRRTIGFDGFTVILN